MNDSIGYRARKMFSRDCRDSLNRTGNGHSEAVEKGFLFYDGAQCKKGHFRRYTSNKQCVSCRRASEKIRNRKESGYDKIERNIESLLIAERMREKQELKFNTGEVWDE